MLVFSSSFPSVTFFHSSLATHPVNTVEQQVFLAGNADQPEGSFCRRETKKESASREPRLWLRWQERKGGEFCVPHWSVSGLSDKGSICLGIHPSLPRIQTPKNEVCLYQRPMSKGKATGKNKESSKPQNGGHPQSNTLNSGNCPSVVFWLNNRLYLIRNWQLDEVALRVGGKGPRCGQRSSRPIAGAPGQTLSSTRKMSMCGFLIDLHGSFKKDITHVVGVLLVPLKGDKGTLRKSKRFHRQLIWRIFLADHRFGKPTSDCSYEGP